MSLKSSEIQCTECFSPCCRHQNPTSRSSSSTPRTLRCVLQRMSQRVLTRPLAQCKNGDQADCTSASSALEEHIHFLRYCITKKKFPLNHISVRSFPNRNCSWGKADSFFSMLFALTFDRYAKSFESNFLRIFFELNFCNFLFIVVQIHLKLFDPWKMLTQEWMLFFQKPNSDFNPYSPCK